MTYEQYYWFIRRQQLARAWAAQKAAGCGNLRTFEFGKTDNPYLFTFVSDGNYDEDRINAKYEDYAFRLPAGKCSSARVGNFHGRNYDWYYDKAPSIVVRTPATSRHKHATLGVATLMHVDADRLVDGSNPVYEFIECAVVDGVNDAGVACNLNVVPPGDNPRYSAIADENEALKTRPELEVRNVTYGTNPGKPRRFVGQICRAILDNCASCDEIERMLGEYSWYAARNAAGAMIEEFHAMASDKDSTVVVEFVENKAVVHRWTSGGTYLGCSDPDFQIGSGCLPIMTNFYLSKWDGNVETLPISPENTVDRRNPTVTEFGMGYERYAVISNGIKSGAGMTDIMKSVGYRQIYYAPYTEWTSEFLLRDPKNMLKYRDDMLNSEAYVKYRAHLTEFAANEETEPRPPVGEGKSWQTVHSSTYDVDGKTLTLFAQNDFAHEFKFTL